MQKVDSHMLQTIADLHDVPQGAYNIRKNGESAGRSSTENIIIENNEPPQEIRYQNYMILNEYVQYLNKTERSQTHLKRAVSHFILSEVKLPSEDR